MRLIKAISELTKGDIKPMQGYDEYFRLRVGDYRVIYTLDNGNLIISI
ncbi:MAG: type II toxin-antitoxin system RelE/ParE family toxin [Lachnospiraceae bacterium]|nr:type II toxin-antitoxin system RelE/ParE family toxin [Lachnospiraceae bacterium]